MGKYIRISSLLSILFLATLTPISKTDTNKNTYAIEPQDQDDTTQISENISIDFSLTTLDTMQQHLVMSFIEQDQSLTNVGVSQYTVTVQYTDARGIVHIGLVPSEVYESNWTLPMGNNDIVYLRLETAKEGSWKVLSDETSESSLDSVTANDFRFPWTYGDTWQKTKSFHGGSIGNAIDFSHNTNTNINVLAIESGEFQPWCYIPKDYHQAMMKIVHSDNITSGYLHLATDSIPTALLRTTITRGTVIGSLYTGIVKENPPAGCTDLDYYTFYSPCGCGKNPHLHFEVDTRDITIQGYTLNSISGATEPDNYFTSTNGSSGNCCGCGSSLAAVDVVASLLSELIGPPYTVPLPEDKSTLESELPTTELFFEEMEISDEESLAGDAVFFEERPPEKEFEDNTQDWTFEAITERPSSASYRIGNSLVSMSGGSSASASYQLLGAAGQAHAPVVAESSSYGLHSGFIPAALPASTHQIPLVAGWNLISSYVSPENPELSLMFADQPDLVLLKNNDGQVYWPELSINDIGEWRVEQGYQAYMDQSAVLGVTGAQVDPAATPIELVQGWNTISYLLDSPEPVPDAVSPIVDNLLILKNGIGEVYWPEYGINSIGDMLPGQGYQVYMQQAESFTYIWPIGE